MSVDINWKFYSLKLKGGPTSNENTRIMNEARQNLRIQKKLHFLFLTVCAHRQTFDQTNQQRNIHHHLQLLLKKKILKIAPIWRNKSKFIDFSELALLLRDDT